MAGCPWMGLLALDRWQSGGLVLNLGFLVLGGALAGLGFGVGLFGLGEPAGASGRR